MKTLFLYDARIQFTGDLVTATPDVLQVDLGADAEFVLLASDGLWDYIKRSDTDSCYPSVLNAKMLLIRYRAS